MSDGHSGMQVEKHRTQSSGDFQFEFTFLKDARGAGEFVLHGTSNVTYGFGKQPLHVLAELGFQKFNGSCPYFRESCMYWVVARLDRVGVGFEHFDRVQAIHQGVQQFIEKVPQLQRLRNDEEQIAAVIRATLRAASPVDAPILLEIKEGDVPGWVQSLKFPRLLELEREQKERTGEIDGLRRLLPLLYGSGDLLERAVFDALNRLNLKVRKTDKGFTADLLAQTPDGSKRFGFEVTGTNGAIKKDSKKLTQVLDFERIKENDEKVVLVASTFNATPPAARGQEPDFTAPVVDFLKSHPILLMTGFDLYRMVGEVISGARTPEEIVNLLHTSVGLLK